MNGTSTGNPPRALPTAAQVRLMLNLHAGRQPFAYGVAIATFVGAEARGWLTPPPLPVGLSDAGRETLAEALLVGLRGPYVTRFWHDPSPPSVDEAVVLLNALAGHRFRWSVAAFTNCRNRGWIDAGCNLTPLGRDALASWLLRGLQ